LRIFRTTKEVRSCVMKFALPMPSLGTAAGAESVQDPAINGVDSSFAEFIDALSVQADQRQLATARPDEKGADSVEDQVDFAPDTMPDKVLTNNDIVVEDDTSSLLDERVLVTGKTEVTEPSNTRTVSGSQSSLSALANGLSVPVGPGLAELGQAMPRRPVARAAEGAIVPNASVPTPQNHFLTDPMSGPVAGSSRVQKISLAADLARTQATSYSAGTSESLAGSEHAEGLPKAGFRPQSEPVTIRAPAAVQNVDAAGGSRAAATTIADQGTTGSSRAPLLTMNEGTWSRVEQQSLSTEGRQAEIGKLRTDIPATGSVASDLQPAVSGTNSAVEGPWAQTSAATAVKTTGPGSDTMVSGSGADPNSLTRDAIRNVPHNADTGEVPKTETRAVSGRSDTPTQYSQAMTAIFGGEMGTSPLVSPASSQKDQPVAVVQRENTEVPVPPSPQTNAAQLQDFTQPILSQTTEGTSHIEGLAASLRDEISPLAGTTAIQTAGAVAQPSEARPSPVAQILPQLADLSVSRGDRIEITLSPDELGRVRLAATQTENGVVLVVQAERPETLDLMRRHMPDLLNDLKDMGFADINYSDGQQHEHTSPDTGQASAKDTDTPETLPQPSWSAEGGLDLRL
jgi:flagellar hook-length control protein FliK